MQNKKPNPPLPTSRRTTLGTHPLVKLHWVKEATNSLYASVRNACKHLVIPEGTVVNYFRKCDQIC